MACSVAAMAAVAPACALRSAPSVRLAPPRPAPCGSRRPALRVRASVHEDDKPVDGGEDVGHYLARAAASLFLPADDHAAPFTMTPYSGTKLTAKDRAHLARYEQVLRKTRDTLEAMPSDAPHQHAKPEHKDIGARLAPRATLATRRRSLARARRPLAGGGGVDGVHETRRRRRAALQGASNRGLVAAICTYQYALTSSAQGTLSGWSGDVPQRKRVVARLDAFRTKVSELKDKAPRE